MQHTNFPNAWEIQADRRMSSTTSADIKWARPNDRGRHVVPADVPHREESLWKLLCNVADPGGWVRNDGRAAERKGGPFTRCSAPGGVIPDQGVGGCTQAPAC